MIMFRHPEYTMRMMSKLYAFWQGTCLTDKHVQPYEEVS